MTITIIRVGFVAMLIAAALGNWWRVAGKPEPAYAKTWNKIALGGLGIESFGFILYAISAYR